MIAQLTDDHSSKSLSRQSFYNHKQNSTRLTEDFGKGKTQKMTKNLNEKKSDQNIRLSHNDFPQHQNQSVTPTKQSTITLVTKPKKADDQNSQNGTPMKPY